MNERERVCNVRPIRDPDMSNAGSKLSEISDSTVLVFEEDYELQTVRYSCTLQQRIHLVLPRSPKVSRPHENFGFRGDLTPSSTQDLFVLMRLLSGAHNFAGHLHTHFGALRSPAITRSIRRPAFSPQKAPAKKELRTQRPPKR